MKKLSLLGLSTLLVLSLTLVAGCGKEPTPPVVEDVISQDYIEDAINEVENLLNEAGLDGEDFLAEAGITAEDIMGAIEADLGEYIPEISGEEAPVVMVDEEGNVVESVSE